MGRKTVMIGLGIVMTLLIALVTLTHRKSDPYQRFETFVSTHSSYQVTFTTQIPPKGPQLTGTVLLQKPRNFLYRATYGNIKFSTSSTKAGYVEINQGDKIYDELPPLPRLGVYGSRISPAPQSIPPCVFLTDLKRLFPPSTTVSPTGAGADKLHGSNSSPVGQVDVWGTVDSSGEVTYLRVKEVGPGKSSDQSWSISYSFPKIQSALVFLTPLPLGYEPFALDRSETPLQKGQMAPLTGWKSSKGTVNLADLAGHKSFLLAYLDSEGPSMRARSSMKSLSRELPVLVIGEGGLSDPTGGLIGKLNPPGSPTFFLVGASGKVMKIWYGYDEANRAGFESDVVNSLRQTS